jgi:hypothetical protein
MASAVVRTVLFEKRQMNFNDPFIEFEQKIVIANSIRNGVKLSFLK